MTDIVDTPSKAEVTKITSEKPLAKIKDPKRVAQGKKLAAISKQAKERKMKERLDAEAKENSWDLPWGYVIGTMGLAIAAGSLFYGYNKDKYTASEIPQSPAKTAPSQTGLLESFD